ncbi:MAG: TonB-dependent receptor [Muribaculaceae bacterium]|nr:TonB-dependent receptor [Muribaculaceae bacterium]
MKKTMLLAAAVMCGSLLATAQPLVVRDSVQLQEVEVLATRASSNTPVAFTNVSKEQLASVNLGKDIPLLLSFTPGLLFTSDAGAGVGYTSMRVRGTDATRINITMNDIPMNDAESHSIYWVNTPDLTSSLRDIQVQRGAGTSTNGSGAFGGSVNMRSQTSSVVPYAEISGSYGSFNTNKETVKFGTGRMGEHWFFDGRLSHISSDGYRDRATSSLFSYFAQVAYMNDDTKVQFISFGGKEDTYHAWDGISRSKLESDRTYNPNGEIKHDDEVTGFYSDQKDIYKQFHYQLLLDHNFTNQWKLKAALHYTDGYGYYQEYKNQRTLKEYALTPFEYNGATVKKSNLVRKKIVDNGFGGGLFSLHYTGNRLASVLGASISTYGNDHYGQVIWIENYMGTLDPDHEYYRNKGKKTDFNIYWKNNYIIWGGLSAYLDLQFRHINYKIEGDNDKWDWTASPEHLQVLNVNETFNFFNPKVGLNWQVDQKNRVYASFAVAQKEPTRNNYTDGLFLEHPRAEKLYDWEAGYEFKSRIFSAGVNFYYMKYKDQLVLNGKLNEIGELMAENVPDSYRCGIELMAGVKFTNWLRWDVNVTFSRNIIKDYVGYVSDYDDGWHEMWTQTAIEKGNTTIAFSPKAIVNSVLQFDYKGFEAQFQSQYVSRQYLDNFESKDDSLDPYFISNLGLAYSFKLPHVKKITVGLTIYNLFNNKYENNGYAQTAAVYKDGDKSNQPILSSDPRFYPMAGTNVLGHITLKF